MKQYNTSSNGYPLVFNGPETVEEYDQKAGKAGQVVEDAVRGIIAWDTLPSWQDAFQKKLAEVTGITIGTDAAATEKAKQRAKNPENVKPVPEKFKAYNARVLAAAEAGNANGQTLDSLKALAQSVASEMEIDPSPSTRSAAPKKDLLDKADALLAGDNEVLEAKVTKFLEAVPYELERDDAGRPIRESLARLIGRYVDWNVSQI